jgi:hypothetical protein
MKGQVSHISALLCLLAMLLFAATGCGGSGSSGGGMSYSGGGDTVPPGATNPTTPGNPAAPAPTTGSDLKTGTFTVTVLTPGGGERGDKVIPYRASHLYVTMTSETGVPAVPAAELAISGPGPHTLAINLVPVGLHIATIEIWTASGGSSGGGTLLAQRKHGFYMTAGGTATTGTLSMGVAIAGSLAVPGKIDIPQNTTLFFENQDAVAQTVTLRCLPLADKTTGAINPPDAQTQPGTPATYYAAALAFLPADTGTWTYVSPAGMTLPNYRVLVYAPPTLTAVGPTNDTTNTDSVVTFTITGTGFGTDQASVNGVVDFIDAITSALNPNAPNITSWGDTTIQGTVLIAGGKWYPQVTVRGVTTSTTAPQNNPATRVYFYKGTGTYNVTVE